MIQHMRANLGGTPPEPGLRRMTRRVRRGEPGDGLGAAALVGTGRGGDPVPVGGQAVVGFDGGAEPG